MGLNEIGQCHHAAIEVIQNLSVTKLLKYIIDMEYIHPIYTSKS